MREGGGKGVWELEGREVEEERDEEGVEVEKRKSKRRFPIDEKEQRRCVSLSCSKDAACLNSYRALRERTTQE